MFRLAFVVLVAASALAVSPVPPSYRGRRISSAIIERAYAANVDEADLSDYIDDIVSLIIDSGDIPDVVSQATAAAQAVGVLIKLVDGIAGDNCWTAALINTVAANDLAGLPEALREYIDITNQGIDHIVTLNEDREAAKYSRGVAGNCTCGGRDSDIDGAWNVILNNANSNNIDNLRKQRAVVQDLYDSLFVLSNNVGAAATATALPQVNRVFQRAIGPVVNFLRAIGTSGVRNAAENAKSALWSSVCAMNRPWLY